MVKKSNSYYGKMYGYTKAEWAALKREWALKLKASGIKDIEKWTNVEYPNCILFTDSLFRAGGRKSVDKVKLLGEKESYYRALGIAANQLNVIPEEFRQFVILISQGMSFPKIKQQCEDKPLFNKFKIYFSQNKNKAIILDAVRIFDEKTIYEDMEEINDKN